MSSYTQNHIRLMGIWRREQTTNAELANSIILEPKPRLLGRAHRQPTQIRRRLAPSCMVNAQHNRSEQGVISSTPLTGSRLSKTMLLELDAV